MTNSPYISIVTAENFETEVLEKSQTTPVLVDFWAGWCNPCKILMPILAKLAEEYGGKFHLAKIDSEQQKGLTEQFNIRSLPTVKIFKLGDVIDEFTGVLPESDIREFIDRHQISESDHQFQSALEALESNDKTKARSILENLLKNDSSHSNSIMLLARIALDQGNNQEVENLLDQVPIQNANDKFVQEIRVLNSFSNEISDINDIELLKQQVSSTNDITSQYQLACYFALNKQYENALENFIDIMQKDRKFKDDAARKNILAIFDILGGSGPLVNIYRVKMSRLLH